jgi:hypothetical protein
MKKKKIKGDVCFVCGKKLGSTYIIAYVIHGRQSENGVKICDINCERKLE